ncbi:tRNA glutamyl-Q(34) synthetase GluQRS [Propylenella binzhouense]|uniref:tRNA glutamyl-Q(34) synthetase GluQRS n=1 Tax=Propylenella binzhouense TaxID=2555902 RepID=A0A964T4F1_9HYPH|nr:tRNA glutamyl-Q(34) synthetase GluQRS [Propylenella binzhouense]MYZ48253.1 tRNA glutamyl-Q(34) synthetase GluQRS [Propylenella binzhouense]
MLPTFRFAPSPNGYLHRGHAFSALLNARAADRTGGRFLLRIEDIDRTRSRPAFEAAICEDLAWLGLRWPEPVLRQSERFPAYQEALAALDRLGLLYPAFLTRAETNRLVAAGERAGRAWPRDPDGAVLYPGPERDWPESRRRAAMADGRPYALRLDMKRALAGLPALSWREEDPLAEAGDGALFEADPRAWGDVVLGRKEVPASYHLAVVVDDAHQSVTHVVRGLDLRPATAVHRVLQTLLGLPEPLYFHHRLILDADGRKLSKSRGSQAIRALRAAGSTPAAVIAGLGL